MVEQVAAEMGNQVKIVGADVDQTGEAASNIGILSIPALVFFRNGKEVHRIVGAVKKDKLVDEIRRHLLS